MNQMRYASFRTLLNSDVRSGNVVRNAGTIEVTAGMWTLTLLSKEGFAGLRRLEKELGSNVDSYELEQESSNIGYEEDEYLRRLRSYVHEEVKGMFHR